MSELIRLIKKYPNRRLYDTQTSSYITLVDVKKLVLNNEEFKVVDAKTEEDITRGILLQIILEEEASGMPMFSSDVLTQIIRFYGHAMQGMMRHYLEKNIEIFNVMQKNWQEQTRSYADPSNKDLWAQFMNFQGPAIQGMMANYLEQSRKMFMQMQEQFQNQAKNMFSNVNFPGFSSPQSSQKQGDKPAPGKATKDSED